jgi:hypothetical protein
MQHSRHRNSELDIVPFNSTATHNFREFHGKGLKYKPMTQCLRLKDFFDRQNLNYLPNSTPKQDKLTKKVLAGEKINIGALNKTINKNLLPVLHAKTYFKSVSTLFTEIPQAGQKA